MKSIKELAPNPNSTFKQGYFIPSNPHKYTGNISNIIYRSSWERIFMIMCDTNESVISWSSEPIAIPYVSPIDGKTHRYFVDFYYKFSDPDGTIKNFLVEIKPKNQTLFEMKNPGSFKTMERYRQHLETYVTNRAKWEAAELYAKSIGFEFKVWTEENLGL
jgi:hypothetical protein